MAFEIRHLQHALALAEARSFARASKSLHLSQSALSRSIQALEKHAGVPLFQRGARGVEPTEAGELFLRRAEAMVSQLGEMERELKGVARRQQPQLRIGLGPYAAYMLAGQAVARCLGRDLRRRFVISVDHWANIARRLREGDLDIVVCELSELSTEDLEIVPLEKQSGCVAVRPGHPLLGLETVELPDLARYPMVGTARLPSRILGRLIQGEGDEDFQMAVHCEDLSIVKGILMGSDGIGLAPPSVYADAVQREELCLIDCLPPEIATGFGLVRRKRPKLSGAAEDFSKAMIESDRESAALSQRLRKEGWVHDRRSKAIREASEGETPT